MAIDHSVAQEMKYKRISVYWDHFLHICSASLKSGAAVNKHWRGR